MFNFLAGFVSDLAAALMFATLAVFAIGIILALDWLWCSFIGWILRIPKD